MALLSESRIYNDLLDLSVKVFEVSRTIPKDYRMSIGRRMEESVLEIGDHLLLANNAEGEECVRHHRLAMAAYERLQFIVNIGARTTVCMTDRGAVKGVSIRQQAQLAAMMTGIGRQMTGLRKYAEKKLRARNNGSVMPTG
jgi:hypothetical protein